MTSSTPLPEQGGEELQEPYKMIVAENDPDAFIDLLCANSFMRGNLNGKIPVNENRLAFEAWLERYRKQHELESRIDEARWFDRKGLQTGYVIDRDIVEERIAELKAERERLGK